MKYMEYKEIKAPDEVLTYLEKKAELGEPATFQQAGFFDWLSELSKEGWRPIWQSMNFPFLVVEREVDIEEIEK